MSSPRSPHAGLRAQPPPVPDPPYEEMRAHEALSSLEKARQKFEIPLPASLRGSQAAFVFKAGEATGAAGNADEIARLFPDCFGRPVMTLVDGKNASSSSSSSTTPTQTTEQTSSTFSPAIVSGSTVEASANNAPVRIGCVLSGGQAAGGHNVICGLFDAIKAYHPQSRLFGFTGGPRGIIKNKFVEIDDERANLYRNTGGFDMIGTGRDKIEKPEEFTSALKTVTALRLDGLVVIGGDDSNTNAAVLAQYFMANGNKQCTVVGAPKTIDNDLKNEFVEVSFGFDSACKVFSEIIGNIATDANSAQKYWHFIRLMGRAASHITLECALATHPNICLIGEEVQELGKTLSEITNEIADVVSARADAGRNFGVVLIPEGLIEFIPEIHLLLMTLNELLAQGVAVEYIRSKLAGYRGTPQDPVTESQARALVELFDFLPENIRHQLLLDRDPHGNVQVSKIETEKLLVSLVEEELRRRKALCTFNGSFSALTHFLGYEGRCGLPSNFDATYCYVLGRVAAAVTMAGLTGYMAIARYLSLDVEKWEPGAIPLTAMMHSERRHGAWKPVIEKALVKLDGSPFKTFVAKREQWAAGECFSSPGPMQFWGPTANAVTHTLRLEAKDRYPGM